MRPLDTTPDAHAVQLAFYRRLGPARCLELAVRMSEEVREITADGIRARHPEYDEAQVRWALFRLLHGDVTFRAAWPRAPVLDP
jgi:hypothetical protein